MHSRVWNLNESIIYSMILLVLVLCEYDVCDVTLSVYPHRTSLENMPGHGGIRFLATVGIESFMFFKKIVF